MKISKQIYIYACLKIHKTKNIFCFDQNPPILAYWILHNTAELINITLVLVNESNIILMNEMSKYKWGTKGCLNKIKYHNEQVDWYYCKNWTLYMFKEGECTKIADLGTTIELFALEKTILDEVHGYLINEELDTNWGLLLDQLKSFYEELKEINQEFEEVVNKGKLKDIFKIKQNVTSLKTKIIESDVFSKYLLHKEMNKHRLMGNIKEQDLLIDNITNDYDQMRTEEDRIMISEKFQKLQTQIEPILLTNSEIEEFKKKHLNGSKETYKPHIDEFPKFDNEKKELIALKIEIEQALSKFSENQTECETVSNSYDVAK